MPGRVASAISGGTHARPLMRPAALRRVARIGWDRARRVDRACSPRAWRLAHSCPGPGALFGVADPERDLLLDRTERLGSRGTVVRFAQTRRGIPVLGGELVVRLDRRGAVLAASGEALPTAEPVDTSASMPLAQRPDARPATGWPATPASASARVTTTSEGLTILDQRILGGPALPGPRLVWSIDARTPDGRPTACRRTARSSWTPDTGVVLETIARVADGPRPADLRLQEPADR